MEFTQCYKVFHYSGIKEVDITVRLKYTVRYVKVILFTKLHQKLPISNLNTILIIPSSTARVNDMIFVYLYEEVNTF